MKKISLNRDGPPRYRPISVFSFGGPRSGKTHFMSSFPRPLFLSEKSEHGYETLTTMDASWWYEDKREPDVWVIENEVDMAIAIRDLEADLKRDPMRYGTVVVDSFTYYQKMYFSRILSKAGNVPDTRRLYGELEQHCNWLRQQLHGMGETYGLNIGWIALDEPPSADQPIGGPHLIGKSARFFPASCDYILYHQTSTDKEGEAKYVVRTRSFDRWRLGGRGGLPDPLPECEYRSLAKGLGIPERDFSSPKEPARAGNTRPRRVVTTTATR